MEVKPLTVGFSRSICSTKIIQHSSTPLYSQFEYEDDLAVRLIHLVQLYDVAVAHSPQDLHFLLDVLQPRPPPSPTAALPDELGGIFHTSRSLTTTLYCRKLASEIVICK